MGHYAPPRRHEFLDVLRRALPGRYNVLPTARAVLLTVVLLAFYLGFPRIGTPMPDMARLAPGFLVAGTRAAVPGPTRPRPMAALPLLELALQLFKLRTQGSILAFLLLEVLAQLGILAFEFLDAGLLCHAPRG
jgi:hypothetical protein